MAQAMTILIIRAMPEAEETAQSVLRLGYTPCLAPLHKVEHLSPPAPAEEPERLIATSARAFHPHVEFIPAWYTLPLHVVGGATARAARKAGFTNLLIAGGDAPSLIRDVTAMASAGSRLLYMAGAPRKPDIEDALGSGYQLKTRLHYRMVAVKSLPDSARSALEAGICHTILHFSAQTTRHLITLTRKAGLMSKLAPIRHICLSPAIAKVINEADLPYPPCLSIAGKPDMPSLLAMLGERNSCQLR